MAQGHAGATAPLPLDEKREYHTLAGLMMEYLQRIPGVGETVQVGHYRLTTLAVEQHRIQKVRITSQAVPQETSTDAA